MRLSRGTLVLVALLVILIVGILLLNNDQAAAPGTQTTPTAGQTSVALFPNVDQVTVNRVSVRDNMTGDITELLGSGDVWAIEATYGADRAADPAQIQTLLSGLLALQGENSFEAGTEQYPLANYGLNQPTYTITVTTQDNTVYTMYVGNRNPAGNRFYTVMETSTGSTLSTAEAQAPVSQESTPEADAVSTVEAAVDVTAEASSSDLATEEAIATPMVEAEATEDASGAAEPPVGNVDFTGSNLPDSNLLGIEETPEPIQPVILEGTRTVYLVANTTINQLIGAIFSPPYVPPPTATATPTNTPNPVSEVDQTATAVQVAAEAATIQFAIDQTATSVAASELTPEATTAP